MKKQHSMLVVRQPHLFITRECIIPRDYRAPICNEFADLLIHEREKRHLSRYAVAKHAHVSARSIGFLETRENGVSLNVASRVLDVFGIRLVFVRDDVEPSV